MNSMNIKIHKLHDQAIKPQKSTEGSAGYDLHACLDDDVIINSMERKLISTGLVFEVPYGYEAQIRGRSGLSIKNGITVLNSPGTIDSDYRNEVKVILINFSTNTFVVKNGMRIAQMLICKLLNYDFHFVSFEELSESKTRSGGFGSTDI